MDELFDCVVEVVWVVVEFHVEVSELVEDELLPLSILQEEQGNEIFVRELDEFLSSEA